MRRASPTSALSRGDASSLTAPRRSRVRRRRGGQGGATDRFACCAVVRGADLQGAQRLDFRREHRRLFVVAQPLEDSLAGLDHRREALQRGAAQPPPAGLQLAPQLQELLIEHRYEAAPFLELPGDLGVADPAKASISSASVCGEMAWTNRSPASVTARPATTRSSRRKLERLGSRAAAATHLGCRSARAATSPGGGGRAESRPAVPPRPCAVQVRPDRRGAPRPACATSSCAPAAPCACA